MKILSVRPSDEKEEMLTHMIIIDEFMTLEWKIPKVITPLQLKAMNSRVNKLFNLSEVPISDDQEYTHHWKPELKDKLVELYNQGEKAIPIANILLEISGDSYFSQPNVVHQQINYLKKIGRITHRKYTKRNGNVQNVIEQVPQVPQETKVVEKDIRNKEGINKRFTEEEVAQIIALWGEGKKSSVEIRDEFQTRFGKLFSRKQVGDKLYSLKKKGMIK